MPTVNYVGYFTSGYDSPCWCVEEHIFKTEHKYVVGSVIFVNVEPRNFALYFSYCIRAPLMKKKRFAIPMSTI